MTDHYPELSGKKLRLLLGELQEAETLGQAKVKAMEETLAGARKRIEMIEETMQARKRARMLADAAAQRETRERGEST